VAALNRRQTPAVQAAVAAAPAAPAQSRRLHLASDGTHAVHYFENLTTGQRVLPRLAASTPI
jgi:hypothetical protein